MEVKKSETWQLRKSKAHRSENSQTHFLRNTWYCCTQNQIISRVCHLRRLCSRPENLMESPPTGKWKHSLLYLGSIFLILHLLHNLVAHKLLLGNDTVRVKRHPDLPLRFRSDGTFKILQVVSISCSSSNEGFINSLFFLQ
jgi:hypothetical protein